MIGREMKADPDWMGTSRKAILIIRVSARAQKENTSLESQEKEGRAYCVDNGLELVRVFAIVESAKDSLARVKYREAFDWADRHRVRHRVFDRGDRESRNLTDVEVNESRVMQDEIVLHYAREQKVLYAGSPVTEFLARDVGAVNHKHYSRELSAKVRRGTKAKAQAGHYPGTRTVPGYVHQRLRNESGRELRRGTIVVPDPNPRIRSRVIRCLELRDQFNWSAPMVREQLVKEGLILPREESSFSRMTIERIWNFDDYGKFYLGLFDWDGIEYQGKHELFVPQDLARRVIAGKRRRSYGKVADGVLGGGWLKCECGCNIVFDPKKKTIKATGETRVYRYYHCTNGKQLHSTMSGLAITEESLFQKFGEAVSKFSISEQFASEISDALNQTRNAAKNAIRRRSAEFQAELIKLEEREGQLFDAFTDGLFDKQEFQRQIQRVRDQRLQVSLRLEEANVAISDVSMETAQTILELATNAESLWKMMTPLERRELLEQVVSNPVLESGTLRFDLQKPFDVISNWKGNKDWRIRRNLT